MTKQNLPDWVNVINGICIECFDIVKVNEELGKSTKHLLKKDGQWIGGWSKEKSTELLQITKQVFDPYTTKCFQVIAGDGDEAYYYCKKHTKELFDKVLLLL